MGTNRTVAIILCAMASASYLAGSIGWSEIDWSLVHTNGAWVIISAVLFWLSVFVVSACVREGPAGEDQAVMLPPLFAAIMSALVFGMTFLWCFVEYLGALN